MKPLFLSLILLLIAVSMAPACSTASASATAAASARRHPVRDLLSRIKAHKHHLFGKRGC